MTVRRALVTILTLTALIALPAEPQVGARVAVPNVPLAGGVTFGTPTVVDPVHTYGEPDIKVGIDGVVEDSGPWGTGTQRSLWNESRDGGRTFHTLHDAAISSPDESDSTISGPGGGDTEISIARDGRVFYADLAALATLKTAVWDKSKREMQTGTIQNPPQNINGFDRQWFALWDPADPAAVKAATGYTGPLPVNYLLAAEGLLGSSCTSGSCESASYSTDGTTYVPTTMSYDMTADGPLEIDQQTGTVFEAIALGDHDVGVAIVTRDPAAPNDPALKNVERVKVADLTAEQDVGALFPVIAFDEARNLYVAWVTRNDSKNVSQDGSSWQIFYSYSTAASGWKTWSTPVQLSSAPSNTNVMPWAVAGADGRLAVVWYGTDDKTHHPSLDDVHQPWNVYLGLVTNAASSSPDVQQISVTRHPMHYGGVCLEGLGCAAQNPPGNRNLADFFEVTTDPGSGGIVITYDDTSNNLKQHDPSGSQAPPEQVAHTGAPVVMMVRQNGGTGLFGTPVTGPKAVGTKLSDRKNDATFDPVYSTKNIPTLDLRSLKAKKLNKQLLIRIGVGTLAKLQGAFDATGAQAIDFVVRWVGPADKTEEGARNPLYYAAVEITASGQPSFFTGLGRSIELCSVSGCFPHLIEYPEPPYGGTGIKGKLVKTKGPKPDRWIIRVPLKLIGKPKLGQLLEDFGVYVLARNKPASQPITNAEAQGGITPIMVDGICCRELLVKRA